MNPYFVFVIRHIAGFILWLMGFKVAGKLPPDLKKFVIIGVPHTANRDFLMALGWLRYEGIRPMFVGKESLFYPFFLLFPCGNDCRECRRAARKTSQTADKKAILCPQTSDECPRSAASRVPSKNRGLRCAERQ